MDVTDVTNENSNQQKFAEFENEIGDPELEARLYAEIYFSNETYEHNEGVEQTVNKTPGTADCRQANRRVENSTAGDIHSYNIKSIELSNTPRTFPKQQRLLARKDLWLRRGTTNERTLESSQPVNVSSKNLATETKGTPNKSKESTRNVRKQANNQLRKTPQTNQTEKVTDVNIRTTEKPHSLKKKEKRSKKKNKNQIRTKAFRGTKYWRRCNDLLNNSGVTTETSKYSIISKRMKLKTIEAKCDTLSISSDSDDSILEVPIPPKAQPPLIELPDSDEDCDTNGSIGKKNRSRSVVRDIKRAEKARKTERVTYEYDEPSTSHKGTDCTNEISKKSQNVKTSDTKNSKTICDDSTDLILNSSDPQRDSLNLRENRIETTEKFSGNNITEKERNHRQILPGREADATRNSETFPVDCSPHIVLPQDREIVDNSTAIESIGETSDVGQNDTNNSRIDNGEVQNEKSKRKRQKDASKSSKESDISETPEKRRKRNTNSSSGNNSMADYFFKPMSSEMQTFYNGPCGSENMNVDDIQSRMPSDPTNWKILHADLLPPTKKRGRVCLRCRNDTHHGKRCPEQASKPSCCMCGAKGHVATRCPQTMCLTCGRKYTSFRQTCCHCSKLSCDMCHGVGHTRQNCPDLWRRFHDTTTETLPPPRNIKNTMKDPQHLSCCNCAKRGHDATMCTQLRWSQHFPTPMYVSSYTEGPFYSAFQYEHMQDGNISGNIEVVDVPNKNNLIPVESTNERFEPRSIFKCGNLDPAKSSAFTVISKRLDILPNVHLDGLLAGDLRPIFLLKWQNHFTFNVNITQSSEEGIRLVVQADSHELLHGIEKTLMQWLTRSDLEKSYLQYDNLSFGNFKRSISNLKQKLQELDSAKDPKKLLTTIISLAQELQRISVKAIENPHLLSSTTNSKTSETKKAQTIQSHFNNLIKARSRLVMSLYARSWVEGGQLTVRRFRKLVKLMSSYQEFKRIREYMEVVYLYNELFTYHESEVLTRALEAVTLTADPMECLIPSLPQDLSTTNRSNLPQTISDNSSNNIIDDNNSQTVSTFPMIANNSVKPRSMSENCATTDLIDTSYQTVGHDFNGPQMSSTPLSLNAFQSLNSGNTLLLNPCRRSKQNHKRNRNGKLLINLKKKKRKMLQRSAREAMHLASTSGIPFLRTMANVLKLKMGDNSIRISDIQSLEQAIIENFKPKQTPMKLRKPGKLESNAR